MCITGREMVGGKLREGKECGMQQARAQNWTGLIGAHTAEALSAAQLYFLFPGIPRVCEEGKSVTVGKRSGVSPICIYHIHSPPHSIRDGINRAAISNLECWNVFTTSGPVTNIKTVNSD